jgi:hypothetical protein
MDRRPPGRLGPAPGASMVLRPLAVGVGREAYQYGGRSARIGGVWLLVLSTLHGATEGEGRS